MSKIGKIHAYVTGPSGAGKTTYVDENYPDEQYAHIHLDEFRAPAQSVGARPGTDWGRVHEAVAAADRPVVIEGTPLRPGLIRRAENRILVDPGIDTVVAQRLRRDREKNKPYAAGKTDEERMGVARELYVNMYQRRMKPLLDKYDFSKVAKVRTELLPHQQRVVDKIQDPNRPGLIVAHGLGSGKTLTSIAAQEALGTPATVVVPASLRANYAKERSKHLSGKSQSADIVSLQGVARKDQKIESEPLLIVDEAHRLRDPATQAYKTVRDAKGSDKRLLLTATPFYNAPSDIAPLVNIAAGNRAMPVEKTEFDRRYISAVKQRPGLWGQIVRGETGGEVPHVNPKMVPELKRIFEQYVDYHPNSRDNFPSVTREDVKVPMTREQMRVYEALMDEAPPWVAAKVRSGLPPSKQESKQLNAFLGAVRQVSNTTSAHQPKLAPQEPKIQKAIEDLQRTLASDPAAKAVLYSNYLDTGVEPVKAHLTRAGIPFGEFTGAMSKKQRDDMVRQYNAGKLRTLLLSSAGGEGLDLKGTRLLQVLEPHWNDEKIQQVEGRGVRFGSHADLPEDQRNVTIKRYLATRPSMGLLERWGWKEPGMSVDEYLAQRSSEKSQLNREFKELLPGYVKTAAYTPGVEQEQTEPGFIRRHIAPIVGAGTAAVAAPLTYALLRRRQLSSNPALRQIQEASNGRLLRTVAEKEPTTWLGRAFNRLKYDSDVKYLPAGADVPRRAEKYPGAVYHVDTGDKRWVTGTTNPTLGTEAAERARLDNKWNEYRVFSRHAPGSMPDSQRVTDVMRRMGYDSVPKGKKAREKFLSELQAHLKGVYPEGFLLKGVEGVQSGGKLPTNEHDLVDLVNQYRTNGVGAKIKELDRQYASGEMSPAAQMRAQRSLRETPGFAGQTVHGLLSDPSSVMVQRKVPIKQPGIIGRALASLRGQPASSEVRVHVIGGQVVPELSSARFDPTMELLDRDSIHGASEFAKGIMSKLPAKYQTSSFAMDVAPLQGGGFKLIESNPGANSGMLDPSNNPLNAFKLRKAMTGQWSPTVAGAGAAVAGIGSAGVGYGATTLASGRGAAGQDAQKEVPGVVATSQVPRARSEFLQPPKVASVGVVKTAYDHLYEARRDELLKAAGLWKEAEVPSRYAAIYRNVMVPQPRLTPQTMPQAAANAVAGGRHATQIASSQVAGLVDHYKAHYPGLLEQMRGSPLGRYLDDNALVQVFNMSHQGGSVHDTARRLGIAGGPSQADMLRQIRQDAGQMQAPRPVSQGAAPAAPGAITPPKPPVPAQGTVGAVPKALPKPVGTIGAVPRALPKPAGSIGAAVGSAVKPVVKPGVIGKTMGTIGKAVGAVV